TIPSATFNVSVGARTSCTPGMSTPPLTCSNASSGNGPEEIVLAATQGQTYYVIVDGAATGDFGAYTMNLSLRPPTCGDGIVSGVEACDDGNVADGDGCSKTCTLEPLQGIDTCPGYPLQLSGNGSSPRAAVLSIDTTGLAANYSANCGGSSSEGVVVVTPDIDGTLTARLTGQTYKGVLFARTTCIDATTETACSIDAQAPTASTREITIANVTAGTPYYLFVDGYDGSKGVGRLNVTVTP
ncbi:MAG: Multiple EGF-like-domain protein 3 precursor, partial [Labilithrix sp.]|nr:Multiple EGF-like-domain protein 3 precursor [Labilithrix sp.]